MRGWAVVLLLVGGLMFGAVGMSLAAPVPEETEQVVVTDDQTRGAIWKDKDGSEGVDVYDIPMPKDETEASNPGSVGTTDDARDEKKGYTTEPGHDG